MSYEDNQNSYPDEACYAVANLGTPPAKPLDNSKIEMSNINKVSFGGKTIYPGAPGYEQLKAKKERYEKWKIRQANTLMKLASYKQVWPDEEEEDE